MKSINHLRLCAKKRFPCGASLILFYLPVLSLLPFLSGCGMTVEYQNTMKLDIGTIYSTECDPIATPSSNSNAEYKMDAGDGKVFVFSLDSRSNSNVEDSQLFVYSSTGSLLKTVRLDGNLPSPDFFSTFYYVTSDYNGYNNSYALAYYGDWLYFFGNSNTVYIRYNVVTDVWETCKSDIGVHQKPVWGNVRKNGKDGWIVQYAYDQDGMDYTKTAHLNDDFSLRHEGLSGDEGIVCTFKDHGVSILDTAVSVDSGKSEYYRLSDNMMLQGRSLDGVEGFCLDSRRTLFHFTIKK